MKKIEFDNEESQEKLEKKSYFFKKISKLKSKKKLFFVGASVLLLLSLFLVAFLLLPLLRLRDKALVLAEEINKTSAFFESQNFPAVTEQVTIIDKNLEEIKRDYRKLSWLRILPYLKHFYQDGNHFLEGGQHLLGAAKIAGEALVPYYDILGFGDDEKKEEIDTQPMTVEERLVLVLETLDLISPQFDQIKKELLKAQAEMDQVDPSRYPEELFGKKIREKVSLAIGVVDGSTKLIDEMGPIISHLKTLLGIPEEKTYFLLFQNDAELRPSGGFMTAYAFLSVHNGKFTPLASHDIYALDQKLGNRIEAPEPILKYLPQVNFWHLRDMNLSPDFSQSMKTFWENYRKIPGTQDVDAIIALDTQVLVNILRVLGEIGVSGWGNFSSENDPRCDCPQVFYELERYADRPVSTWREERKGIIGPLMHSILANIMGSPRKKWPEFLSVFFSAIREKHLLFYFFDQDLQGTVEALNAGGKIKEFEGDYFHLNDCNFAGAKSNMYIQEKVTHEIEAGEGGFLVKTVTVDYKNPFPPSDCNLEKGELCLNGLYRDWFRLFVPKGSQLLDFSGSEVEVKTYEELEKTVFEGFYGLTPSTSLRPEGKLRLTFKYRLPFKLDEDSVYRLLVQKQPGTLNHDYEIKFGNQVEQFKLDSDKEIQLQP